MNNKLKITYLCYRYNIINYTNNPDGSIDVDGNVHLNDKELKELPLKFNKVTGDFKCHNNQLTSLKGSPQEVGGEFYCHYNQLTTLEGCPQKVGGAFICGNNQLTTLQYAPQAVSGIFSCSNNQLTSLEYCPQQINGIFDCFENKLTSLKGIGYVEKEICCGYNPIPLGELLDMDSNKLNFDIWWLSSVTVSEWLEKFAIGTEEEKMEFKLRYL